MRLALLHAIVVFGQAWMSELFAELQNRKKHEKILFYLCSGPFPGSHDPKFSVGNCSIYIDTPVFHEKTIPTRNGWMLKAIRCVGSWKDLIAARGGLRPPLAALESPPSHAAVRTPHKQLSWISKI